MTDSSTPSADGSQRMGDFEIIRELGRGGMGVVYEAKQNSLNRRVALKVLSSGLGLTTKAIMRFKREAEAAARLHHTNIVPIYFTGDEGRVPYYAMELVDGPSLDQVIWQLRSGSNTRSNTSLDSTDDGASGQHNSVPDWVEGKIGLEATSSLSSAGSSPPANSNSASSFGSRNTYFDNVARMMSGVADALAHAHDQGVIHRDIKPSNLLLSQDGRLSVNDFGLARMLEQPGMTISGELMGSPMYMSPEQIAVGRIPLDHRTDIYSLGASLYELLTLQTPFDGQQRDQVLSQIIHKEPSSPRSINKQIPRDLETICQRAMEKDPDRRYQTADQMAADLQCFVNRHAISARRIGLAERAVRWARKNKALTAMACLTLVVGIGATMSGLIQHKQAMQHREETMKEAQLDALEAVLGGDHAAAKDHIRQAMGFGAEEHWKLMLSGQMDLFNGKPKDALEKLLDAVKQNRDHETRNRYSVMVRAMLAEAYLQNGDFGEYLSTIRELETLAPESWEDHLFKGYAVRYRTPKKAIRQITRAIDDSHGFTVARVLRAAAFVIQAQDEVRLDLALAAIRDVDSASVDMSTSPLLSNVRLHALLTAYQLCSRKGEDAQAAEHLKMAERDVEQLKGFPGYLLGNKNRLLYYEFSENLSEMAEVMKDAVNHGNSGFVVEPYAAAFYGAGGDRIEDALVQLEDIAEEDVFVAIAKLILRMEEPADQRITKQDFRKFIKQIRSNSMSTIDGFQFFILNKDERLPNTYEPKSYDPDCVSYMSGDIDEGELIRRAGSSQLKLHIAHFNIGIRQLIDGERPLAKKSFEKSANSPFFNFGGSMWSRAFLARIDDSNWPSWLHSESVNGQLK